MRYHEIMTEALNHIANHVIKDDRTYRTFVGDGKRWSSREKDGQIFPDYLTAQQKIEELRLMYPGRKFFSQEVG
jgi:hypothetical protein